jgi:Na+/H+-dicarboxylate symporter
MCGFFFGIADWVEDSALTKLWGRRHSIDQTLIRKRGRSLSRSLATIPLPLKVMSFLALGLVLGLFFPRNPVVKVAYLSGTYFPRFIVTLAALLVFQLLTSAMAKLILYHKDRAGILFLRIFALYVVMSFVSLIYATVWLGFLSDLPLSLPAVSLPAPLEWARQIGSTFYHVISQQPLLQVLGGGLLMGWLTASIPALHRAAYGFIAAGDLILSIFRKLLWYYPIMIGCLAIGIPLKFGRLGLALYGQCVLWDMIVIVLWSLATIVFCKAVTRRSWKQILSYYGAVWPTGFGTGGSYDTLAVNLTSAEKDLGLSPEIAEVSIVFGTVLNKNCTSMSVLIVTVIVARLLSVPISLAQIALLVPPVAVLALETPGIPGGAAYFMSPIIAVLLHVPNEALWVTTFIAAFSGLIPMFSTAGNTTTDGVVGAILEDRFQNAIRICGDISSDNVAAKRGGA